MSSSPLISVILPVFNGEAFVAEAVESILDQTFTDLELIVIDDGSIDRTPEILAGFRDSRLRSIRFSNNEGYVTALNHGLDLAQGQLIARQDADDRSRPERLRRQVAALEADERLVLLGTGYTMRDLTGREMYRSNTVCRDLEIRWNLLFQNAFAHSTVIFRKETLDCYGLRYEQEWMPAEDYRLWSRLATHGRVGNLSAPLVDLRSHPEQVSRVSERQQRSKACRVAALNQRRLGCSPPSDELDTLCTCAVRKLTALNVRHMDHLRQAGELLTSLCREVNPPRVEVRRLKEGWVGHVLSMTRVSQIPALWRSGLARDLIRISPTGILRAARRELLDRLLSRVRE